MTLNLLRKRNFNRGTVFYLRAWDHLGSVHCSPPAGCLCCFAFFTGTNRDPINVIVNKTLARLRPALPRLHLF